MAKASAPRDRHWVPARLALSVILSLGGIPPAHAEDRLGVESSGAIRVVADWCAFRGDSLATLVEVYLQTFLDHVAFSPTPEGQVEAEIWFEASLLTEGKETPIRSWSVPVRIATREEAAQPGLALYDRLDLAVRPGSYTLRISARDPASGQDATLTLPVGAPDFGGAGPRLSDVQLARSITLSADEDDPWMKNGYRVLPHPSRRYGLAQPSLWWYAEAYGLKPPDSGGMFFTLSCEVTDPEGRSVFKQGPYLVRRAGTTAVLVGEVPTRDLAPGYYRLTLCLEDTATVRCGDGPHASTLFIRAEDAPLDAARGLSPAESTAAELELRFAGTASDVRRFRSLTPVGRARFLARFWASKDPDPSTPENEARAQLHARIATAQARFRETGRMGIDTDRGRVYITYGPPSEVSRLSGELRCKDHEIWIYRKEREYEFVFFDETGAGAYRLIHSNHPGEVSRSDWGSIVCETPKVQTF